MELLQMAFKAQYMAFILASLGFLDDKIKKKKKCAHYIHLYGNKNE